jgi:hypothetical protein
MASLAKIISIGEKNATTLDSLGIRTPQSLILSGASSKGRKEIANKTGFSGAMILMWVKQAELFMLSDFGEQDANLLQLAGVLEPKDLAQQKAETLHRTLLRIKRETNTFYPIPTLYQLTGWIKQSKQMLRLVTY